MSAGVAPSRTDRPLLALVAVFVPARAPSLLSQLGGPGAAPLQAAGTQLASLARRERLLALAAALGELHRSCTSFPASMAVAERPRTREILARGGSGAAIHGWGPPRPALTRLLQEAREAADGPPGDPITDR